MTPEKQLKKRIREHLRLLGAYAYAPVPRGMGIATLDFLVCLRGRFVAIEAKALGEKPTARQDLTIKTVIDAGGVAFYCDSYESYLASMWKHDFLSRS